MNEDDARKELQIILNGLYDKHINFQETHMNSPKGSIGFVEQHIQKIYKVGGGDWSPSIASQYVQSLRADFA